MSPGCRSESRNARKATNSRGTPQSGPYTCTPVALAYSFLLTTRCESQTEQKRKRCLNLVLCSPHNASHAQRPQYREFFMARLQQWRFPLLRLPLWQTGEPQFPLQRQRTFLTPAAPMDETATRPAAVDEKARSSRLEAVGPAPGVGTKTSSAVEAVRPTAVVVKVWSSRLEAVRSAPGGSTGVVSPEIRAGRAGVAFNTARLLGSQRRHLLLITTCLHL